MKTCKITNRKTDPAHNRIGLCTENITSACDDVAALNFGAFVKYNVTTMNRLPHQYVRYEELIPRHHLESGNLQKLEPCRVKHFLCSHCYARKLEANKQFNSRNKSTCVIESDFTPVKQILLRDQEIPSRFFTHFTYDGVS